MLRYKNEKTNSLSSSYLLLCSGEADGHVKDHFCARWQVQRQSWVCYGSTQGQLIIQGEGVGICQKLTPEQIPVM